MEAGPIYKYNFHIYVNILRTPVFNLQPQEELMQVSPKDKSTALLFHQSA